MGEKCKALGNIVASQLKDDVDIQLKHGQFCGAVSSLCAKFRGNRQDTNVASKLFYSYCCSFYGCQLCDLSCNYIEDIYVAWQKAIRRTFNLPYNIDRYLLPFVAGSLHIQVNLVSRYNMFLMHWCLVTVRSWSFWCTTAISAILHWVSIENSWIPVCTIVINAIKSQKLMRHFYCHHWMVDVQIGLSVGFRKMRLNVWFTMFVSINLDSVWWYIFLMSESTFPCPTVLYEWLIILVFIFIHINMFIFLCILGSSESE